MKGNRHYNGRALAVLMGCMLAMPLTAQPQGMSKQEYLEVMEMAVGAYSDAHLAEYLADVEKYGVQEHGFPRLAANLGILVANGRHKDKQTMLRQMLDAACRDAVKGKMPPKSGGNEFGVKELVLAVTTLEKAGVYPKAVTEEWRRRLSSVVAETCYTTGDLPTGRERAMNWTIFGAASEQERIHAGMGGDAAFVERFVADQLKWFDENGMYRDPHQPAVYDFVTRLQCALVLDRGFDGPSRGRLEALMDRAAEPTLRMLSACGEIPYGGRSNQFLHNNTFYAALCEWYAARFARRHDAAMAGQFRRAAREAMDALRPWLAERPLSHVKNRYARVSGKAVYSEEADMGCERYAYFDKYMITMGSWAMCGWLFAQDDIPAAEWQPTTDVFVTTPDFHWVLMRAGDYSAQFDYQANPAYDASGLGRIQRRGAPAAIALSTPCGKKPHYRIEAANDDALTIGPAGEGAFAYLSSWRDGTTAAAKWRVGAKAELVSKLTPDGMSLVLTDAGALAMTLPAFDFDGREATTITAAEKTLTIAYRGWRCGYETNGKIVDTRRTACNRNGRYRRFEARGENCLKLKITITPL